jgi:large subunit ribosomal protein L22
MSLLETMPHRGARILRKTVKSAASNALNINKQLDEDMLYVREVLIDEGPRMKRVWFRARGRADMLLKRLCHVTVVIDETGTAGPQTAGKAGRASGGTKRGSNEKAGE